MTTVSFRTVVLDVPPSPMGLLPRKFVVSHRCNRCGQTVLTDQLVEHAQAHEALR
jgi:hypothetical protein